MSKSKSIGIDFLLEPYFVMIQSRPGRQWRWYRIGCMFIGKLHKKNPNISLSFRDNISWKDSRYVTLFARDIIEDIFKACVKLFCEKYPSFTYLIHLSSLWSVLCNSSATCLWHLSTIIMLHSLVQTRKGCYNDNIHLFRLLPGSWV